MWTGEEGPHEQPSTAILFRRRAGSECIPVRKSDALPELEETGMKVTDLVDVTILREINASLADTLGVSVILVDADDMPVNEDRASLKRDSAGVAHAPSGESRYADGAEADHDGQPRVAIPLHIGETPIGALRIERILTEDRPGRPSRSRGGRCRDAVDGRARAPRTHELTARLASLLASAMADAESVDPGVLDQAGESAAAVLNEATEHRTLRQIADGVPIGLLSVDRHGEITWSNRPAKELLGLSPDAMDETEDRAMVCTVASVDGADPMDSYVRITRELAGGRTVRNIRCLLCRQDGSALGLQVDAAPVLSGNHRIDRVLLTLQPADDEVERTQDGSHPSWSDVRAILNVVNTRAATKRAHVAHELQSGVVEELQCAWLELDSLRQEAREAGLAGCLDSIASYLQRAAAHAVMLRSECWPQVWDELGLASALESRLADLKSRYGVDYSFDNRSHNRHPLDATRCTVLYRAAEEILGESLDCEGRMDVVLDANEHYWLLTVSADGSCHEESSSCHSSAVARAQEHLRTVGGALETTAGNGGRLIHCVILPVTG